MLRLAILLPVCLLALILAAATWQRQLLYFPTHRSGNNGLSEWRHRQELIGFARKVPSPKNVWLMLHGNGGQASDRAYALASFSPDDSVYILEYPGYGTRPGAPSRASFDAAARQAYHLLRESFPRIPVCVLGESLGTGPASVLAGEHPAPDKIVLVAPFDQLHRVAAYHYPFLPVSLLLADDWDNVDSLRGYEGRLDIFAMRDDQVIPAKFAKALADSKPGAIYRETDGGHNDWADTGRVAVRNP